MNLIRRGLSSAMLVLAGIAVLSGCKSSDNPVATQKQGNVTIVADTVSLGRVVVGQTLDTLLTFTNSGDDSARIKGVSCSTAGVFGVTVRNGAVAATLPYAVAPGATFTLLVHFVPMDVVNYSGMVTVSLANCKDTSAMFTIEASGMPVSVAPNNTYTYSEDTYDASNTLIGSINFTQTAASITASFAGVSPVVNVTNSADTSHDYYEFKSNGDIAWYYTPGATVGDLAAGWYMLPYGTRSQAVTTIMTGDSTITVPTFGAVPVHYVGTVRYIGDSVVNMGARGLRVQHAQIQVVYTAAIGAVTFTADLYYSPTIGFFALRQYNLVSPALLQSLVPTRRTRQAILSCVLH